MDDLNLKVGDRVDDPEIGRGSVTEIHPDKTYRYWVTFDCGRSETYTKDGHYMADSGVRLRRATAPQLWVCRSIEGGWFISAGRYDSKEAVRASVVDAEPIIAIPGSEHGADT